MESGAHSKRSPPVSETSEPTWAGDGCKKRLRIWSSGHGQATRVGTMGTAGSSQRLLGQHLLRSCVWSPRVARPGCAGALRGLQLSTRRSPGWLEPAPRSPSSGPHGHRSCCSGSAMLFQPLFALHSLLHLFSFFFFKPPPSAPLLFPFASFSSQSPGGVFTHHHRLCWPKSLPETPRQGLQRPGEKEELRNNLHGRVTLGLFVHRLDKSARRLGVRSTRVCI